MTTQCSVPDCPKPIQANGLCSMHRSRLRRTGSLEATVLRGPEQLEARYWQKVDKRGPNECWPWTASLSPDGYGKFRYPGGQLAHRFSYELIHGPIPGGAVIDHTCHTPESCKEGMTCLHRRCQNPAHMEPVSVAENGSVERRHTPPSERTHCPQGHAYDEANTLWSTRPDTGHKFRQCRACARERARRRATRDR